MSQLCVLKMTLWINFEGCWWENEVLFSQMRTSGWWYKHLCTSEALAVEEQPRAPPLTFTILLLCNISNAKIGAGVRQMEASIMSSKDLWGACAPKLKYLQSSELAMHKL